jgi:hypothetical protein
MSEASEVEARFAADGTMTVLSFTWRGHKQPVVSQGRQWQADDGLHFLLMTPGEQIVELVFARASGLWQVADRPARPLSA